MKCSLLPGFHGSTTMFRWELKSLLVLYTAPWNPLFQAVICVLGACISMKEAAATLTHLLDQRRRFHSCNLRPFFTFVPSIGAAYVWFVASFWVICSAFSPPTTSVAAFPTEPVSEAMICRFLLFGNDIPCFPPLLWVSAGVIYPFLQWQHTLITKLTRGFSGITIVNRLAFISTVAELNIPFILLRVLVGHWAISTCKITQQLCVDM